MPVNAPSLSFSVRFETLIPAGTTIEAGVPFLAGTMPIRLAVDSDCYVIGLRILAPFGPESVEISGAVKPDEGLRLFALNAGLATLNAEVRLEETLTLTASASIDAQIAVLPKAE